MITFKVGFNLFGDWPLVLLPADISQQLPSRGMVMIEGTLNKQPFTAPLEPDGKGSHWFRLTPELMESTKGNAGETLELSIQPMDQWTEPSVPHDLEKELVTNGLIGVWNSLTVKARWEWIRWIRFTKNPATRAKRIGILRSKLEKGDRRPCCFDSTRCTVTEVSKSGKLMDIV